MKLLVASHPDDEIIWFNAQDFDKIIIVFIYNLDKLSLAKKRFDALEKHPLADKISILEFSEVGFKKHPERQNEYNFQLKRLQTALLPHVPTADIIYTHNRWGERGHADHILVHEAVMSIAGKNPVWCLVYDKHNSMNEDEKKKETRVNEMDLDFFKTVKKIYKKHGAWTWFEQTPPKFRKYYKAN